MTGARKQAPSEEHHGSPFARARPLIIARAVVAVTSAALPLVLARTFTPRDYGTYKQLFLVAQTLYFVLQLGVPQSLYFFIPRVEQRRPYLIDALLFLTAMGLFAAIAVMAGAPRIATWLHNPSFPRYAPAVSIYLLGVLCSVPLEVSLTAQGHTRAASAVYLGSEVVRAAAMTLPAALGLGLSGVMDGVAVFGILRLAATWAVVPRGATGPWMSRPALREQLRYALPFGAAVALAVPQGYFHQYVVAAHVDPSAFALYAVGVFQLPVIDLIYTPTSEVLMVGLGELERDGRHRESPGMFRGAVSRLGYAFFPLAIFLVVAAPQVIGTLFTNRYLAAVPIYRVGVCSALLAILPLEGALRARGETWQILAGSIVKAVATVPAVLVGVSRFGMVGAVGAWLVSEILGKAVLLARLPRALGARMALLLPWPELGRAAVASLVAAAATLVARGMLGAAARPLVALLLCAAVFGGTYALGLAAVGARLPFELVGLDRLLSRWVAGTKAPSEL